MKNKVTFINIISNMLKQIMTIITGFLIPRLILSYFGSEVNGLISSITQFLNYITLIEGGITGVVTASLYKPLIEKDYDKVSSIYKTAQAFYKKISIIIVLYTISLSILYPLFFNNSFSFLYVSLLVIILAVSLFNQYAFCFSYRSLFVADKKGYIESFTKCIISLLTIILSFVSLKIFPSIHILKLISGLLYLIQPIVYIYFSKKYYKLDKKAKIDNQLIKNRWNGFAVNIAYFIHVSTDIVILTIFTDLKLVSIYSVYNLVAIGLTYLLNSISTALNPTLGQSYAKRDFLTLNNKMDQYEIVMFFMTFFEFSIGALLVTPFVMIYTSGVNDINYYQPVFGVLLLISQGLDYIITPHTGLAHAANKYKEMTIPSYIEAIINIVLSLILVKPLGLIGITIGTIAGMLYRMGFHVWLTSNVLIKDRSQWNFYKKMIIFILSTAIGVIICKFAIPNVNNEIIDWVWHALVYAIIFGILYLLSVMIFFKKELNNIIMYFFSRNKS